MFSSRQNKQINNSSTEKLNTELSNTTNKRGTPNRNRQQCHGELSGNYIKQRSLNTIFI